MSNDQLIDQYSLPERYMYKDPALVETWLRNVIIYDAMLAHGAEWDIFDEMYRSEDRVGNNRQWFEKDDHPEFREFAILGSIKAINSRTKEVVDKLYAQTRLSRLVNYSEVSNTLFIATKAHLILTSSAANPTKKLAERIDGMLKACEQEYRTRETSVSDVARRAIVLSVFPPYMLKELPVVGPKSLEAFSGGKGVVVRLNRGMDLFLAKGASGRFLGRLWRRWRNKQKLRRYRKMGLFRLSNQN